MPKPFKYPPELIGKWIADLNTGKLTKDGIMQRWGINRNELNRRLRAYKPKKIA